MECQQRDKHMAVESFRSTKAFFSFERQHTQLPEEVITHKKTQHRRHPTQHQPVVSLPVTALRLNPANDKKAGKESGHELTQICTDGGMGSKKSSLLEPLCHHVPRPSGVITTWPPARRRSFPTRRPK